MTDKAPATWRYNFVFLLLTAAAVGLCARLALLVRGGGVDRDLAAAILSGPPIRFFGKSPISNASSLIWRIPRT